MTSERTIEAEISVLVSNTLRHHFGKGPASVYVTLKPPFITIHFRGLSLPMEKILLKQGERKRVLKTRDLIANEMKEEVISNLSRIAGITVNKLFTDWNLETDSGILIGIAESGPEDQDFPWMSEASREAVERKVEQISEAAQKKTGVIRTFWLSQRTLLIERREILVGIEKALIRNGYTEPLKLAKRPLERSLLFLSGLEDVLMKEIDELFLDWDFEEDIGFIVILLKPV